MSSKEAVPGVVSETDIGKMMEFVETQSAAGVDETATRKWLRENLGVLRDREADHDANPYLEAATEFRIIEELMKNDARGENNSS